MTGGDVANATSMAAQHADNPITSLYVAPTEGSKSFNTIRLPIVPVACWRLGDPAFDFDSSFVLPTFNGELAKLAAVVQSNVGCPVAIFAHADPAGSDELNKTISDRRAIAVYGLLTRQPAMWEDLYANPADGDAWGKRSIQAMLQTVLGRATDDNGAALPANSPYYAGAIDGDIGPETEGAIKQFQTDAGLTVDGDAGPKTRKVLFGAYMDALCTPASSAPSAVSGGESPPPAPAFRMKPSDFLGGAGAADGDLPKASLQGCSRFNPRVLLTSDEMNGADKAARNAHDAPNRRVLMFFYPPETKMSATGWPCPKVKDPADACKSSFWRDGDQRRQNGDVRRDYQDVRNTMACKFYDRFARLSPCEGGPQALTLRLHLAPTELANETLLFHLASADGAFAQDRTLRDGVVSEYFVDVRFRNVPQSKKYSIVVSGVGVRPFSLFDEVPFAQLDGFFVDEGGDDGTDPLDVEPPDAA